RQKEVAIAMPCAAIEFMKDTPCIEVELKTLRLTEPFRIAHGTSSERQVVRVRCDGAIGEAPFVPYYGDDPSDTTRFLKTVMRLDDDLPPDAPRPAQLALDVLRMDHAGKRAAKPA